MTWSFQRLYRCVAASLICLAAVIVLHAASYGQTPAPTPPPQVPVPTPNVYDAVRRAQEEARRRENLAAIRDRRFDRVDNERRQKALARHIEALYRKPDGEEKKLLRPSEKFTAAVRAFLKLSNTGLVKLIQDQGCSENSVVIVASEHCLKYSMPGSGSSYSFRTKSHRIPRLSDMTFSNGMFRTAGVQIRGILVDIGDVPIEQVTLQTRGVRYLREYRLASDIREAIIDDRELAAGKTYGGLIYKRSLAAKLGTTYLLRSAAYRGPSYKAFEGIAYDEFSYDDRRDITIVFRILGEEADGITIVYLQLESKKSPAIKSPKKNEDLTKNKFTARRTEAVLASPRSIHEK